MLRKVNVVMSLNEKNMNFCYNFGYNDFGPILLSFSNWLLSELTKKNIKKVYFFSRDGLIIKKAFDIINENRNIKSYYFYASRRSIIVPALWKARCFNEFYDKISLPNKISIKKLLKKLGLENTEYIEVAKKYNLNLNQEYSLSFLKSNNEISKILEKLYPIVVQNSKKEYSAFMNYCQKNDFNGDVAIVDIGWHGSMQKALNSLNISGLNIYGYYVGLTPDKKNNTKQCFGYLFENETNINIYEKFRYFISIFEFLFLANHGSVKKFENNRVVFKEYEYEGKIECEISAEIQKAAIDFVGKNKTLSLSRYECIKNIEKDLLFPTLKTANFFGNISFLDDEILYIAKPRSIIYYCLNLKKLKTDFIASSWRIGFLKRLLKIPINYYKLNEYLRKIFLKENDK